MFSILPAETLRLKLRYPTCSDYVYIEDITGSISIFSICFRHGGLCVLDGLQQLRPMTLSALAPLLQEGMLWGNWSRCFWEKSSSEDVGTICGEDLCSVGRAHTSYFLVSMKEWIRINNLFTADDVAKGMLRGIFLFHFQLKPPGSRGDPIRWCSLHLFLALAALAGVPHDQTGTVRRFDARDTSQLSGPGTGNTSQSDTWWRWHGMIWRMIPWYPQWGDFGRK